MAGASLGGGSTFEGNDGNIVANGAIDWANLVSSGGTLSVGPDQATGQCDNSFTQGSKEDETAVVIGLGSIPNSKADLGKFAVGSLVPASGTRAGHTIMALAWIRNNQSGTTNFDFEINQLAQPNMVIACGQPDRAITLQRTGDGNGPGIDDILLSYDVQGGAQNPTLSFRRWTGSVWGPSVAISGTDSEGLINTNAAITLGNSGPFGQAIPASQFGEADIDMTALGIIPNQNDPNASCVAFGSAYVKSRSSNSFSAQMKDYIAPIGLGIDTCGSITIDKVTVPSGASQSFGYTTSANLTPFSLTDAASPKVFSSLNPGTYSVTETLPVTGWDFTSLVCNDANGTVVGATANIHLDANEDVLCTYTNTQRGKLIIDKVTQPNPDPTNTAFDFDSNVADGNNDGAADFTLTNSQTPNDSGFIVPGTYRVDELTEPGWTPAGSSCSDNSPVTAIQVGPGETVTCTFTNNGFGHIIVDKITDPPGDPTTFQFVTTGTGYNGFGLKDTDPVNDQSVAPGAYSVNETLPDGWTGGNSTVTCVSSIGDTEVNTALEVDPGETITCTFNNRKNADITVIKQVVGPDPGQGFTYTSNFGVPTLTPSVAGQGSFTSGNLANGGYGVTEDPITNWLLKSATCAGDDDGTNPATIQLDAGEHVVCTFVNEWQVGAVLVHKTVKHADANSPADLSGFNFTIFDAANNPIPMPPTDANGNTCVDHFGFQGVTVHEEPRNGYTVAADQQVTIDHVAYCDGSYGGAPSQAPAPWINKPVTTVSVSVDSIIPGGTRSEVHCVDANGDPIGVDGVTNPDGDGTFGPSGYLGLDVDNEAMITCTIFIDP